MSDNKIIGSGGCDYTDTIVPLDYVPEAFEFANRKQFHTWKMIGMQISHSTVGGIQFKSTLYDSSGRIGWGGPEGSGEYAKGISSGCLLIEEVNQNNHLIGRGANYFRAKSDASGTPKTAAYGILGHTNTPGIEWGMWNQWNGQNAKTDVFTLNSFDYPPIGRGWGRSMGQELCGCATPGNSMWHMGVFIKDNNPTPYQRNNIFLMYSKDQKCPPGKDPEVCQAEDSRLPGRFTAWADGYKLSPYRTCEATMGAGTDAVRLQGTETIGDCKLISSATFGVNDISGAGELPFTLGKVYGGVTIKLTSLPTCNHFDKLGAYPPAPNDPINRQIGFRCERAVLRILPGCRIDVQIGKASAKKFKAFEPREFHYDRWDRSDSYVGCYKIFDEVFDIPELKWQIRILAHHKSVLENWADVQEYGQSNPPIFGHEGEYRWEYAMTKQFLTGGSITGVPTGKKGCTCSHKGQDLNHYPVRPYNQFTYCPNNFTCEKTCSGVAGTA